MGWTDIDLLFARRGDEQVVVTIPIVLAKTLAWQLAEAVRLYAARLWGNGAHSPRIGGGVTTLVRRERNGGRGPGKKRGQDRVNVLRPGHRPIRPSKVSRERRPCDRRCPTSGRNRTARAAEML